MTAGRPFVTWKYAATLDGLSAAPDGTSKWITSEEARRDVQVFRAEADAIVAGTGAVIADDPRLTVRDEQGPAAAVRPAAAARRGRRDQDPQLLPRLRPGRADAADPVARPATVLQKLVENDIRHIWL